MNHHHRSVWDSLAVNPNAPTKSNEKLPLKVQPRRNGDVLNHNKSNLRSFESCHESGGYNSHKTIEKMPHSDSVFDYLRQLQDGNEKILKSVLRNNNASTPQGRTTDSLKCSVIDLSDDRGYSEDSVESGNCKSSTVSPSNMEVPNFAPIPSQSMTRVDVKETYQFAFVLNNDPSSMAIPECADSFEASYQIQATVDKNGAMDIPVNFEPQLFLSENRSSFEEFLKDAIDSFLHEVQIQLDKSKQLLLISNHLSCHEESVCLRRRVFSMICAVLPDLKFQPRFDSSSPHFERFLDSVVEVLSDEPTSDSFRSENISDDSIRECFVELCDDPVKCLSQLKIKIMQVVQLLLPQLRLPETFDIDKDIPALMTSIVQCAR